MKPNSSQTISRLRVHHACDIEGNFRKQEITRHILHTQNQAKQDLPDEQADSGNEIGLGDSLRLIFHDHPLNPVCSAASLWPC